MTQGQNAMQALVLGQPAVRQNWVMLLRAQQWHVTEHSDWLDTLPNINFELVLLLAVEPGNRGIRMIQQLQRHFPHSYFCAVLTPEQLSQLPDLLQIGLDDYVLSSATAAEQCGRLQRLSHRLHQDYATEAFAATQATPNKISGSISLKQFPYLASHHLRQTLIRIRRQLEALLEDAKTPIQAAAIAQILERTRTVQQMLNAVLGDTSPTLRSPPLNPPLTHQDYIIVDHQFLVQQYSEGVQQYAEADCPVTLGQNVQESFPELMGVESLIAELLTGQTKGYELSGIARRSTVDYPVYFDLYINVYGQPASYQQSGYLIILINNATERMLFQQQLIQSANEAQLLLRKLATTKNYIAEIINAMADALIVTTQSGIIKKTNPAAQKLFGYQDYEMLAQPITHFVSDEAFLRKIAQSDFTDRAEVTCQRRNQESCYISFSCGIISTEEDNQEYVYVGRDVTERKQAEAKIQQLNHSLQERTQELEVVNEELESFSRTVSHDLKTPLSHIDFFNQLLLEEYGEQLPAEAQDYIRQIHQAGQRMQQLIHDLLQLSRATRMELDCATVDLSAIAHSISHQLRGNAPERVCRFLIPQTLPVWGNAALLRIVLENLLQNAWKYTRNEAAAQIEVGVCSTTQMPIPLDYEGQIFFVRDNGVGFDMAYADKLFRTFSRLHSARDFEGTGIGLTTVQRIIHRHGGQIWAEAAVGEGAVFYFTLASAQSNINDSPASDRETAAIAPAVE
ncbi:MAG: PAS domain S-box protein [Spirulina sp. SIO3F2]|nr:PAS domain S-box protein [Spirulina sp. SIO3F2]